MGDLTLGEFWSLTPREKELTTEVIALRADLAEQAEVLGGMDELLNDLTEDMTTLYRPIAVCTQDPCSYCGKPARRQVAGSVETGSPDLALVYGRTYTNNILGGSAHRVEVEQQHRSAWVPVVPTV